MAKAKKVSIEGMSCAHCVNHVKEAISAIEGVNKVKVSLEAKNAIVKGEASDEDIKAAVREAGYEVTNIEEIKIGIFG